MRTLGAPLRIIACLALFAGACGNGISVGKYTLNVASTQYLTTTGQFCIGLHAGQIKVQLADYSPVCKKDQTPGMDPRDPTIEHVEMDFVLSTGGMPDFRLNGFPVAPNVTCTGGGGPAYVAFVHYPAGAANPDSTVSPTGGQIRIQQLDPTNFKPLNATYDLTFPSGHLSGSFSVKNCD